MPTPLVYQGPEATPLFEGPGPHDTAMDLLYITDRGAPNAEEEKVAVPYGETRGRRIAFGSARVRLEPEMTWQELEAQSTLGERTQPVTLDLGEVRELGAFPREPYDIALLPGGIAIRAPQVQAAHDDATQALTSEIKERLAASPSKEVVLYIHGFNETFETAAYTSAELCHFLGREPVCAFFTWPSSHTGNFLISYTSMTESASYSVDHLKKTIRLIAALPEVERVHILAHSRGTALTLDALHRLMLETIAAGRAPADALKIGEVVLLSPDVDMEIAAQQVTAYLSDPALVAPRVGDPLPRGLWGNLTIYASPEDRALRISKILFRSRHRLGQLSAEDITPGGQAFLAKIGKIRLITYEGDRTDMFGHAYFTSNPAVSADLIELLRYGTRLGESGRDLTQTGPVTWAFPEEAAQ